MKATRKYDGLEIAIIGMSGRFPKSNDCREYWQNLKEGRELLKAFSDDELRKIGASEAELQDERYVRLVGVLDDKDCFDHGFFGYSVEEAALMDPQTRLFHEQCWKALEDAGYSSLIEKNKIGLFAGATVNNNWKIYAYTKAQDSPIDPFYINMLTSQHFISSLVSYKLDLRGPSFYVDTACSTSLAAVHLACRSLLTRECTIALAGGVSVSTRKSKGYFYQEGMVASKDGHCRTFDAQASGCAIGEGVGVIVLKRLSEAIKDRDHIYSIIRASSVNNDGKHKVGYTAPSVKGQADCILAAQKLAGIDPRSISYIEAHGTATKLGDPVEIRALNEAFGVGGGDKFCAIGSVKSNMGHLDTAAGVAGLIKTALSLTHRQIPASLHFKAPNPEIDFAGGPFYVNAGLKEWERKGDLPLRAGVNSLGIGGTNAHVILEEAPEPEEASSTRNYKLLTVSARTADSLTRYLEELKDFLSDAQDLNLADMSYTLQLGRKHFTYRRSIVYKDREDLLASLHAGKPNEQIVKSKERKQYPVFIFPGQGSQYIDMGKDLYENDPLFRKEMDQGFSIIERLTGEQFKDILFSEKKDDDRIQQTRYTQPIIFLVEYALARLVMSLGVEPASMIGHSIGEYVAACVGGVFSFEDGLRLVIKRGALMNSLPEGDMLSIPITAEEVQTFLDDDVCLAAVNGPEQVVVSGDKAAIDRVIARLDRLSIPYSKLRTSHAFHSHMQDPILEPFRRELEKISFNKLQYPFISNLTGNVITEAEASSPDYWVRHLRQPVRFSDGVKTILSQHPECVFIEVGAGHTLTSLVKQQSTGKSGSINNNLVRSFKEVENDERYFAKRIGGLWAQGLHIDWNGYYQEEKRSRVSLPTYSFEPIRYPTEVDPMESLLATDVHVGRKEANAELKDWIYYPSWKRSVLSLPTPDQNSNLGLNASVSGKVYLFFSFDREFSRSVGDRLSAYGSEIVEVFAGEVYSKRSERQYVLSPGRAEHFLQLLNDLQKDKVAITDIIYSWGIGVDPAKIELEEENKEINLTYFSIVNIIQAFVKMNGLEGKRLTMLTESLHKVIGTEEVAYGQSLMLGLMKVLAQEYPVTCCNIDLHLNGIGGTYIKQLAAEIESDHNHEEHIVALRHGQRWVQSFQRNLQPVRVEKSLIKRGGTYLITGGLGNVGFVLARHLIERHDAKIILIGRKRMEGVAEETSNGQGGGKDWKDDRSRMDELLEGDQGREEWLVRFDQLRSMSKDVRYFTADVLHAEELTSVVDEVERSSGHIQGVIHAAGVSDNTYFELIEDTTVEKAMAMFAPKIKGIECIYTVFKDRKPDFVWMTSSISAALGGLGFSAYASANLFMDHFVYAKSGELVNWKCVELAEMAFTAAEVEKKPDALKPGEIGALFEWSLGVEDCPVIMETVIDLSERMSRAYAAQKEVHSQDSHDEEMDNKLERPDLSTDYTAPETETEKNLKTMFEQFFGIESIGVEDDFFELGGDSLKAMMLLKRVKKEFAVNLSLKDFLIKATVRCLSAKIDEILWFKMDVEMENEIRI